MQGLTNKLDYEAKMNKEKKENERRKNILVHMYKYLLDIGFAETALQLHEESKLDIDKYEVADNIDLYIIFAEFEEFFEVKFNRKPKFISKINEEKLKLPNIKGRENKLKPLSQNEKRIKAKASKKIDFNNNEDEENGISVKTVNASNNNNNKLEIIGTAINKKIEKKVTNFETQKENILLKPFPEFLFPSAELKEMAYLVKKEIIIENPNVNFEDIIGLERGKLFIKEALMLPMKYPQLFTGILEPWKGILLYGPPGTGKTLLAKAVATEMHCTFFNISASTIVSKWRGDSEKIIRVLFDLARYYQPSTIFLDEIDSIMNKRSSTDEHEGSRRMKTELLIQLDGLVKKENERVFILAASNLPWDLDQALLRRLEKRVYVPLPGKDEREEMLKKFIPSDKQKDIDFSTNSELLVNYSGSDIRLVCKEALMTGVRRSIEKYEKMQGVNVNLNDFKPELITNEDFINAFKKTKPASFYKENDYELWNKEFGTF